MEIKNKIYISGPITGLDYEKAKATFDAAERRITKNGFIAVNPMRLLPEGLPYGTYMRTDIAALLTCDSIYMLEGFGDSIGALIELNVARVIGLEIIYEEVRATEPLHKITMINKFMERNPGADAHTIIREVCPYDVGLTEDSMNVFCSENLCAKCWRRDWEGTKAEM